MPPENNKSHFARQTHLREVVSWGKYSNMLIMIAFCVPKDCDNKRFHDEGHANFFPINARINE